MNQIILDRFTSATDLKNRTKFVLDKTDELWEVFIVNNNKPRAVLLSIRQYNDFIQNYNPILWDLISMSEKEKNKFDKSKDSYLNWDFISEEEFFSKLS
jgi:prevent-host-death family protein